MPDSGSTDCTKKQIYKLTAVENGTIAKIGSAANVNFTTFDTGLIF